MIKQLNKNIFLLKDDIVNKFFETLLTPLKLNAQTLAKISQWSIGFLITFISLSIKVYESLNYVGGCHIALALEK